jgi:glycosyltransferase involved in cell wall biosynthesis
MKILWVNTNFLHPTTKGGRIRTLEMVRRLHRSHEIHYAALRDPAQPEGPARAGEYSTRSYPVEFAGWEKRSVPFLSVLARSPFSRLPVAIGRWRSAALEELITGLRRREKFDSIVLDFLVAAVNVSDLAGTVLFQHNVEAAIWHRHAVTAANRLKRAFLNGQARRMEAFEREVCRSVAHVIAVSEEDAVQHRRQYGVESVSWVPTGVDFDYFAPRQAAAAEFDLMFLGSMDWMPNIDGMQWFAEAVLPLIRARRPETTLAVVGRQPPKAIQELGKRFPGVTVTGTVADVRPYLWKSKLSIVPLRVGGGTRLKIYESVAAGVPVVSTTIGAEGLDVDHPGHIRRADTPESFAEQCLELLDDVEQRRELAEAAWEHVSRRYGWDSVTRQFEEILQRYRR